MAGHEQYDNEELYDDVPSATNNGQIPNHSYNQPPLPNPRVDPKAKTRTLPIGKSGPPSIPNRAPSTSITTSQTMPKQQEKKKVKGKKETKQAPPPPVSGGGGLDMKEILRKRQAINTKRFDDLENTKKDDDNEEKQLAPWQLEKKKKAVPIPSPRPSSHKTKVANGDDDDVPEFIKKRRSMSFADEEDIVVKQPPTVSPLSTPITPINEEHVSTTQKVPPVQPKPKPAPRAAPKRFDKPVVSSSPPAPRPKPNPRKDSLPGEQPSPPFSRPPPTTNSLERNTKPPIPIPPKPGTGSRDSSPQIERRSDKVQPVSSPLSKPQPGELPPSQPEELPPPPFKPPPPKDSPVTARAFPPKNVSDSPPKIRPPIMKKPDHDSPSLKQKTILEPKPPTTLPPKLPATLPPKLPATLPPKPLESLPTKPLEGPPPSFKSAPPLPVPVQSQAEPTPPAPSVLKYRRLPLPAVDINNPPPLPCRSKKPHKPSGANVIERPPLIPTESQESVGEEIYDDTMGVTNDIIEDDGEAIYDDTIGLQPELGQTDNQDEELYDDVSTIIQQPPSLPSRPAKLPPIPSIDLPPIPGSDPPSIRSPPPTISVPPIPTDDQEEYEDPSNFQSQGQGSLPRDSLHGDVPLPPIPPSPRSSLPPPPSQQLTPSPQSSPTLSRKGLTKEEKKQIKEDEKKAKELKRLELLKEKEKKKRDEQRAKNRQKTMKAFKDYKLPDSVNPLYSVEVLADKKGSKDHLTVNTGEKLSVILITHDKLPRGKYLCEKEDGSIGLVDENITERTVYLSVNQLGIQPPSNNDDFGYGNGEDLYEPLDNDPVGSDALVNPSLSPNTIPTEDEDQQDVYECLPDN